MVVEQRVGDFNTQDLANTAWAFAKAGHPDEQLLTALARVAKLHLGDFTPHFLAIAAWGFAAAA